MLNQVQQTAGIAAQEIATKSKGKDLPSQKKCWLGIGLGNGYVIQIW
ncbi:hypothetical protein [Pectobacterium carotovorum]|nr:hypothetical protein [Pectobacterium carotovorum]MDY4376165.1 hypothetical protein [Pectobacterium carotovorum subsp. carotovorum]